MKSFLPSEIARLVLGYLSDEGWVKSYQTFLTECVYLAEYRSLISRGEIYPTMIGNKTLCDMLEDYGQIITNELYLSDGSISSQRTRSSTKHRRNVSCRVNSSDGGITPPHNISNDAGSPPSEAEFLSPPKARPFLYNDNSRRMRNSSSLKKKRRCQLARIDRKRDIVENQRRRSSINSPAQNVDEPSPDSEQSIDETVPSFAQIPNHPQLTSNDNTDRYKNVENKDHLYNVSLQPSQGEAPQVDRFQQSDTEQTDSGEEVPLDTRTSIPHVTENAHDKEIISPITTSKKMMAKSSVLSHAISSSQLSEQTQEKAGHFQTVISSSSTASVLRSTPNCFTSNGVQISVTTLNPQTKEEIPGNESVVNILQSNTNVTSNSNQNHAIISSQASSLTNNSSILGPRTDDTVGKEYPGTSNQLTPRKSCHSSTTASQMITPVKSSTSNVLLSGTPKRKGVPKMKPNDTTPSKFLEAISLSEDFTFVAPNDPGPSFDLLNKKEFGEVIEDKIFKWAEKCAENINTLRSNQLLQEEATLHTPPNFSPIAKETRQEKTVVAVAKCSPPAETAKDSNTGELLISASNILEEGTQDSKLMTQDDVERIAEMTRTDPAFDALFSWFNVDKNDFIEREYGITASGERVKESSSTQEDLPADTQVRDAEAESSQNSLQRIIDMSHDLQNSIQKEQNLQNQNATEERTSSTCTKSLNNCSNEFGAQPIQKVTVQAMSPNDVATAASSSVVQFLHQDSNGVTEVETVRMVEPPTPLNSEDRSVFKMIKAANAVSDEILCGDQDQALNLIKSADVDYRAPSSVASSETQSDNASMGFPSPYPNKEHFSGNNASTGLPSPLVKTTQSTSHMNDGAFSVTEENRVNQLDQSVVLKDNNNLAILNHNQSLENAELIAEAAPADETVVCDSSQLIDETLTDQSQCETRTKSPKKIVLDINDMANKRTLRPCFPKIQLSPVKKPTIRRNTSKIRSTSKSRSSGETGSDRNSSDEPQCTSTPAVKRLSRNQASKSQRLSPVMKLNFRANGQHPKKSKSSVSSDDGDCNHIETDISKTKKTTRKSPRGKGLKRGRRKNDESLNELRSRGAKTSKAKVVNRKMSEKSNDSTQINSEQIENVNSDNNEECDETVDEETKILRKSKKDINLSNTIGSLNDKSAVIASSYKPIAPAPKSSVQKTVHMSLPNNKSRTKGTLIPKTNGALKSSTILSTSLQQPQSAIILQRPQQNTVLLQGQNTQSVPVMLKPAPSNPNGAHVPGTYVAMMHNGVEVFLVPISSVDTSKVPKQNKATAQPTHQTTALDLSTAGKEQVSDNTSPQISNNVTIVNSSEQFSKTVILSASQHNSKPIVAKGKKVMSAESPNHVRSLFKSPPATSVSTPSNVPSNQNRRGRYAKTPSVESIGSMIVNTPTTIQAEQSVQNSASEYPHVENSNSALSMPTDFLKLLQGSPLKVTPVKFPPNPQQNGMQTNVNEMYPNMSTDNIETSPGQCVELETSVNAGGASQIVNDDGDTRLSLWSAMRSLCPENEGSRDFKMDIAETMINLQYQPVITPQKMDAMLEKAFPTPVKTVLDLDTNQSNVVARSVQSATTPRGRTKGKGKGKGKKASKGKVLPESMGGGKAKKPRAPSPTDRTLRSGNGKNMENLRHALKETTDASDNENSNSSQESIITMIQTTDQTEPNSDPIDVNEKEVEHNRPEEQPVVNEIPKTPEKFNTSHISEQELQLAGPPSPVNTPQKSQHPNDDHLFRTPPPVSKIRLFSPRRSPLIQRIASPNAAKRCIIKPSTEPNQSEDKVQIEKNTSTSEVVTRGGGKAKKPRAPSPTDRTLRSGNGKNMENLRHALKETTDASDNENSNSSQESIITMIQTTDQTEPNSDPIDVNEKEVEHNRPEEQPVVNEIPKTPEKFNTSHISEQELQLAGPPSPVNTPQKSQHPNDDHLFKTPPPVSKIRLFSPRRSPLIQRIASPNAAKRCIIKPSTEPNQSEDKVQIEKNTSTSEVVTREESFSSSLDVAKRDIIETAKEPSQTEKHEEVETNNLCALEIDTSGKSKTGASSPIVVKHNIIETTKAPNRHDQVQINTPAAEVDIRDEVNTGSSSRADISGGISNQNIKSGLKPKSVHNLSIPNTDSCQKPITNREKTPVGIDHPEKANRTHSKDEKFKRLKQSETLFTEIKDAKDRDQTEIKSSVNKTKKEKRHKTSSSKVNSSSKSKPKRKEVEESNVSIAHVSHFTAPSKTQSTSPNENKAPNNQVTMIKNSAHSKTFFDHNLPKTISDGPNKSKESSPVQKLFAPQDSSQANNLIKRPSFGNALDSLLLLSQQFLKESEESPPAKPSVDFVPKLKPRAKPKEKPDNRRYATKGREGNATTNQFSTNSESNNYAKKSVIVKFLPSSSSLHNALEIKSINDDVTTTQAHSHKSHSSHRSSSKHRDKRDGHERHHDKHDRHRSGSSKRHRHSEEESKSRKRKDDEKDRKRKRREVSPDRATNDSKRTKIQECE